MKRSVLLSFTADADLAEEEDLCKSFFERLWYTEKNKVILLRYFSLLLSLQQYKIFVHNRLCSNDKYRFKKRTT